MRTSDKLLPGVVHIPKGSKLHGRIIENFKRRKRLAKDEHRKQREKAWEESEDMFTACILLP